MQIESYEGAQDVIEFVERMDYDTEVLAFDEPIVVRSDGRVIAVANYQEHGSRVEIVTDDQEAALAVCKHFAGQIIKEVDCSNAEISERLQGLIDRPFAHLSSEAVS